MPELRAALEGEGYGDVRTVAQSGNVVLVSATSPPDLERELARVLRGSFGFEVKVVVRTREELAEVIARDPFGDQADDPSRYQVSFLGGHPDPTGVEELEASAVAPGAWP